MMNLLANAILALFATMLPDAAALRTWFVRLAFLAITITYEIFHGDLFAPAHEDNNTHHQLILPVIFDRIIETTTNVGGRAITFAFDQVVECLSSAGKLFTPIPEGHEDDFLTLRETLELVAQAVATACRDIMGTAFDCLSAVRTFSSSVFATIRRTLVLVAETMTTACRDITRTTFEHLVECLSTVRIFSASVFATIRRTLVLVAETMTTACRDIMRTTFENIKQCLAAIRDLFTTVFVTLRETVNSIAEMIATACRGIMSMASEHKRNVVRRFSRALRRAIDFFRSLAARLRGGDNTNKIFALPMSETYLQIVPRAPRTLAVFGCREIVLYGCRDIVILAELPSEDPTSGDAEDNSKITFLRMFYNALCTVFEEFKKVVAREFSMLKELVLP